jgi:hypothetical protein
VHNTLLISYYTLLYPIIHYYTPIILIYSYTHSHRNYICGEQRGGGGCPEGAGHQCQGKGGLISIFTIEGVGLIDMCTIEGVGLIGMCTIEGVGLIDRWWWVP